MLRYFLLVVLDDIFLRDMPAYKNLEYMVCTLLVVGALCDNGVSKGMLLVLVSIYLVVLDGR